MIFDPPLVAATLVRRYKRFLFDAVLEDGSEITGFCANTGSMRGLTAPGSRIYLSQSEKPGRKYRYGFELIEADGTLVGVNTSLPNRLAHEAIRAGLVSDLLHYPQIRTEQRYGENSRIDLLLSGPGKADCYVEVKNVHFIRETGLAEFPDSVTTRGAKHLTEMAKLVAAGKRAAMLYVIQRQDCDALAICADLDPAYGRAFTAAISQGVEAYAVKCAITPGGIIPSCSVPVRLTTP
ncbi:DNA/RNA nuclease SfsA [Agrobacterium vitis]|uniref:Sugar fermentation stimulation protein homolog n=1 Tax=Agrobacterium vitis TaxID=373 RepID=A0AAE5AVA2_AGRVI|nr:DNA/RNA nuclease SfsA [Agrobacterium vitis]MCF1496811.1 DNA/RNA nuclease SfsA [Allorhizobium sp. Av2]MCM2439887.1 DNA/RNA nuclease SfsA [Agrobacterium vitis]MUZ57216.1 DNA/RNA nuclease SfsA [Agrobacterium vitis]MVA65525.1 DNA/RNA nuclease SfsA [Agrobacterium vitis]MVA86550.1 DNA/RNA nuclease SfsA [Agrobacterium vitis]